MESCIFGYDIDPKMVDVCVENLKRETRRYAKRQITWFKRNSKINWFSADLLAKEDLYKSIDDLIYSYIGGEIYEE